MREVICKRLLGLASSCQGFLLKGVFLIHLPQLFTSPVVPITEQMASSVLCPSPVTSGRMETTLVLVTLGPVLAKEVEYKQVQTGQMSTLGTLSNSSVIQPKDHKMQASFKGLLGKLLPCFARTYTQPVNCLSQPLERVGDR